MTKIHEFDEKWQEEYPEGYSRYFSVYEQRIVSLYLWYLKHIRRYGYVKLFLLDDNKRILDTIYFILEDSKIQEGPTHVNGQLFPSIHDAWNYYQNMIFNTLIIDNKKKI